jgi:hypothetical protein
VPFIYDHDFNLIGEFQEPKYSRILNQLLKSPKLDFDSTFKYLIIDDYSDLKWLNKDSSFLDYIEKQELEVTSKDKRNPLKHNTVEIGLDFTNQEVFITRTIFKEDELTGENIWIDTYESLYFRLDENDNLTQEPSYQYHSEVEKHNILKSSLAVMNNNLDTTYSKIRLERSMFNQMKTDSMIMSFYEENNFRKNDMTIYLDFRYMPSKKLMRIFPESYYDDTQTGERVYSEFVIDNFHFKIEEYSKAVEITKEEYYRIFFEE